MKNILIYTTDHEMKTRIKRRLIENSHKYHALAALLIAVFQAVMIVSNVLSGNSAEYRRVYFFLFLSALLTFWGITRARADLQRFSRLYMMMEGIFLVAICLWSCIIVYMDFQKGSNDISVFSYTVMGMAAFIMIEPWISFIIYFGIFLLLNLILYLGFPMEWGSSVFINSASTLVLACMVTAVTYRTKVQNIHRELINEEQFVKIQRMNEELHDQAYTDGLTGLYNRRYLEEKQNEKLHFDEYGAAVMMIDIDNFKLYNDFYGHQKGDECLKKVADMLQKFTGTQEAYAVRYGGEEFMLFFAGCPRGEIREKAERLRQEVINMNIVRKDVKTRCVTISVGVSEAARESTMKELILHSDIALYEAKNNGKNQVRQYVAR